MWNKKNSEKIRPMKSKYITSSIIVFLFLYLFLIFDVNFHGPDEPIYYAYTASIIEDGDLNIINQIDRSQYAFVVSETYNWPDNHSYGGITLWIPFYAYAKLVYFLGAKFNLQSLTGWNFSKVAKCAMSFSTIVFALLTILLTYKLCKGLVPPKIASSAIAIISVGTPFFYYVLHDVGQANVIGCFLSVLTILFCMYMVDMKRRHWFLYGMFFSLCLAVRIELWLQLVFICPLFVLLCKSKRIDWRNGIYFFLGFMPLFLLRGVNAYIKYGALHMEELLPLYTVSHFYSPFNGLFSAYRGVFYTSPILYICVLGIIFVVINLFKNHHSENRTQDFFLFMLALYLLIKLFLIRRAFGFGIDILGSRWLLSEFPIFVVLFAQVFLRGGRSLSFMTSTSEACCLPRFTGYQGPRK